MANTTNMKIDRNEVPEDILRRVKLDEFEAATCTPISQNRQSPESHGQQSR